jgi:hypothetical protein
MKEAESVPELMGKGRFDVGEATAIETKFDTAVKGTDPPAAAHGRLVVTLDGDPTLLPWAWRRPGFPARHLKSAARQEWHDASSHLLEPCGCLLREPFGALHFHIERWRRWEHPQRMRCAFALIEVVADKLPIERKVKALLWEEVNARCACGRLACDVARR